ncbi:MAG: dockerin type I repeat-containing protein, partial [Clostridia bacterium]|nr:dockerin type I repeat-containing protein [Clostridia bacterium]
VLGAIHVDDGSGEVLVFLDGYINCNDGCEPDEQGYHDLSWVKEGAYITACGIASIGQNSYENSDQIGPRIRTRSRADIVKPVPVYGDANCDGKVTSADAALVLRALVGLTPLTLKGAFNADVSSDFGGMPNGADAVAILRYVVKLIETFEAEQVH